MAKKTKKNIKSKSATPGKGASVVGITLMRLATGAVVIGLSAVLSSLVNVWEILERLTEEHSVCAQFTRRDLRPDHLSGSSLKEDLIIKNCSKYSKLRIQARNASATLVSSNHRNRSREYTVHLIQDGDPEWVQPGGDYVFRFNLSINTPGLYRLSADVYEGDEFISAERLEVKIWSPDPDYTTREVYALNSPTDAKKSASNRAQRKVIARGVLENSREAKELQCNAQLMINGHLESVSFSGARPKIMDISYKSEDLRALEWRTSKVSGMREFPLAFAFETPDGDVFLRDPILVSCSG